MTTIEERVSALEESARQGGEVHRIVADSLKALEKQVGELLLYLSSNGGVTLSVRDKRVKFAGSVSLPWAMALFGSSSGGVGWLLGRVFGAW